MKSRFNNISETGLQYSLYLLFLFPLFPLKWSGIFLFLLVVFSILNYTASAEKTALLKSEKLFLFFFLALPAFYLLELVWTDDIAYVWRTLQRKLGLILIPIALLLVKRSGFKFNTQRYFDVYIVGVLLLVAYTVLSLFIFGLTPQNENPGGVAFALRTEIESIAHLHPTYFGLIVSLALLLLTLKTISNPGAKSFKIFSGIGILFLFLFLFALVSRMALFASVLALMAAIFRQDIAVSVKWLMGGGIVLLCVLVVIFVPSIQHRVLELFNSGGYNSTSLRTAIYHCGLYVAQQNWLFGTSVAELQTTLNDCYHSSNPALFLDGKDYNTHNEFLNVLNAKGIFGLLLFLAPIYFFIRKSRVSNAMLVFTILVSCIFMTENILERQVGVFFYPLYGIVLFLFRDPYSPKDASASVIE